MNIIEDAWLTYQSKLLSFIKSKVQIDDAQNILNDVFVKLLVFSQKNEMPENVSAWLYRVTRNQIIDYYRTKKDFEVLPEDLFVEADEIDTIKQLSKCMIPMINKLPENFQQPLILAEIEGKKYKQVAQELGLSVSAIKSRILRGRQKLYKNLLICCSLQKDKFGNVIDYQPKLNNSCGGCS